MKYLLQTYICALGIFTLWLIPSYVFGAQLYLTASHDVVSVGDTLLIHAQLDTENELLNAIEGTVLLDSKAEYEFNTAGSVFTIWPTAPTASLETQKVSFVGGVPDGVNSSKASVFNIAVKFTKEGIISIAPEKITAYKNDGKGTAVPVVIKSISVRVVQKTQDTKSIDEWINTKSTDTEPPLPFSITLGKDSTVYDGKQFIVFSTVDKGSGIDYYEVTEGDFAPVQSDGVYVLKNELGNELITVSAYDKAGNVRTETFTQSPVSHSVRNSIIMFVVCMIIFVVLYRRRI